MFKELDRESLNHAVEYIEKRLEKMKIVPEDEIFIIKSSWEVLGLQVSGKLGLERGDEILGRCKRLLKSRKLDNQELVVGSIVNIISCYLGALVKFFNHKVSISGFI